MLRTNSLDCVQHILQGLHEELQRKLAVEKSLASRMYGWKPPLIGRSKMTEINSQVDRGLPKDAFRTWFDHAYSNYTTEYLQEFCKCLRSESEEEAKPKLLQVADLITNEIDRAIQGESSVVTQDAGYHDPQTLPAGQQQQQQQQGQQQVTLARAHQSVQETDQQTVQPSTTPVEDQRTLAALREAHKKLKKFYTKPDKYEKVQFINLALAERPNYVDKTKKDVKEFLEATAHGIDRYTRKEKNIKYAAILTSTGSDSGKRVLVSGSPGSGKTTLAHQLCRDLYSGHLPNEYQLVLFTELKAFRSYTTKKNKEASLLTLLEYLGLPEPDSLCSMIKKEEGRGVAIILDGYDEISDVSCKTLAEWVSDVFCDEPYLKVSECDVFLTTRPSQLSLSSKASVHLEILGFSSSDIKCYIKDYFKSAPDRAEEVIRRLTNLPLVRGLCSNPRVLEIACKILKHQDEEPLPANLSSIFLRYLCYQLEADLTKRQPPINMRIKTSDLLSVPEEHFPGFYTLCSLAYDCCLRQQLMLEKQELGEVNKFINSRGSVYNLLFGKEVDSPSEMSCVLYQCDHKTVMEALAAVHIAVLSPAEQQQIWDKWFTAPHMAQVWMMYCGLTGLNSVDLRRLFFLTVSERSREVAKDLKSEALLSEDKLVMVSLFESSNNEEAKLVLPVLLKNAIRGYVRSQYDVLVLAYSIAHHPHLSRVRLDLPEDSSVLGDLQPLTTSLKNVKAVELTCNSDELESVLTVLPRAVEELSLVVIKIRTSYKKLGDALRDCHCLRSLTISTPPISALWTELGSVLNSNSQLTEFHVKNDDAADAPSVETLKNLLAYREKCSLKMTLAQDRLFHFLSGLQGAEKMKELVLHIQLPVKYKVNPSQSACAEVEDLVATHPHLVKVIVQSSGCKRSELLIAVAKGAISNKNVTHLELVETVTRAVHPLLCSPSADHITSIRTGYMRDSNNRVGRDADDAWSNAVIKGPMARQTCHLDFFMFAPASLGLLLSRVNTATKLKDLSLKVHNNREVEDHNPDVLAVETAFTNCTLHKLRIKHNKPPAEWCRLYSAILNGLAANTTAQVDSCIYTKCFDGEKEITSRLSSQTLKRFELVRTHGWFYIISRDPSCPSVPALGPLLNTPSQPTSPKPVTTPPETSKPVATPPETPKPVATPPETPKPVATPPDPLPSIYVQCPAGPTAPRTRMDEKIGCSLDIHGVSQYREGLIGEMQLLGSVLGIGEDTKAILRRHGSVDDHLLQILDRYIKQKIPTWQDFCNALKKLDCFNNVRAKIEADHSIKKKIKKKKKKKKK